MAWAIIVDGAINRTMYRAIAFVHPVTGNKHPRRWLDLATSDELTAAGIIEITISGSHKNAEYYNNAESSPVYDADAGTVTITYSSSAKTLSPLQDSHAVKIKKKTNKLLNPTDWYVTRKYERSVAIPDKIIALRAAILAVYTAVKSAIAGANDIDELAALYTTIAGATASISVDGTSSSVVSTSNNTITKNGHGFVNDELITYEDGQDSADKPIKGLASGQKYYVIGKTTNTFKLSLTPTFFGDEAVVSLTGVADAGDAHVFTSNGKPAVSVEWPSEDDLAYRV